ncbi:MAG: hypothetical protein QW041_01245 [Candidatus Pacearchaeota archaeon]
MSISKLAKIGFLAAYLTITGCQKKEFSKFKSPIFIDYRTITNLRLNGNEYLDSVYWGWTLAPIEIVQEKSLFSLYNKFADNNKVEFLIVPKIFIKGDYVDVTANIFVDNDFTEKKINALYGYENVRTNTYRRFKDKPYLLSEFDFTEKEISEIENGKGTCLEEKVLSLKKFNVNINQEEVDTIKNINANQFNFSRAVQSRIKNIKVSKSEKPLRTYVKGARLKWKYKLEDNYPLLILKTKNNIIVMDVGLDPGYNLSVKEFYTNLNRLN